MKQNARRCLFLLTFSFLNALSVEEWRQINDAVTTKEFSSALQERLKQAFSDLASMNRNQNWDVRYRLLLKHALDRALRRDDIEFIKKISSFARQARFTDLVRETELILRARSFNDELTSFAKQFRQKGVGGTPDMLLDELSGEMRGVLEQLYKDINYLLKPPQQTSLQEEFEQQERESWQSITQRVDKVLEMIEQRKEAARHPASQQELERAQRELQALSNVVRLLQTTMGQLGDYVSSHREKIGEYKTQVQDLTRQRIVLQKQVEDIRQACQETAAESVARREQELSEQRQRIGQLQQELEQLRGIKGENISLKQTVRQYEKKLGDLSSRQSESDVIRQELQKQFEEMQRRYQECSARIKKLQEQQASPTTQAPSQHEHEAYVEQVRELERDNKQLQHQLRATEEHLKTIQAEAEARKKLLAVEMQETRTEAKRPFAEHEEQVKKLERELKAQQRKLEQLRDYQTRLKVALDTAYDAAMKQLDFFWSGLLRRQDEHDLSGNIKDYHQLYKSLQSYDRAIKDIKRDGAWDFFALQTLVLKREFIQTQLALQIRSYIEVAEEQDAEEFLNEAREQLEAIEKQQEALFEHEDASTLQNDIVQFTRDYETWKERYDDLLLPG